MRGACVRFSLNDSSRVFRSLSCRCFPALFFRVTQWLVTVWLLKGTLATDECWGPPVPPSSVAAAFCPFYGPARKGGREGRGCAYVRACVCVCVRTRASVCSDLCQYALQGFSSTWNENISQEILSRPAHMGNVLLCLVLYLWLFLFNGVRRNLTHGT